MTGSAKAHYEGIKAFSETDQTDDLKSDYGAGAGDAGATTTELFLIRMPPFCRDKLLANSELKNLSGLTAWYAHVTCGCD